MNEEEMTPEQSQALSDRIHAEEMAELSEINSYLPAEEVAPTGEQPQQPQQPAQPQPQAEQPQQQATEQPKEESDQEAQNREFLKNSGMVYTDENGKLQGGSSSYEFVHGVTNTAVGLVNLIPGVSIPRLPKFAEEGRQAASEVTGLLAPMMFGAPPAIGALTKAVGPAKIGHTANRLSQVAAGYGMSVAIDAAGEGSEGMNASGQLKQNWPKTWRWIPDWLATTADETPDVKRKKNVYEGLVFQGLFDQAGLIWKYVNGKRSLDQAIQWIPESEKAKTVVKELNKDVTIDDLDILSPTASAQGRALDELGAVNTSLKSADLDSGKPVFGYHDLYDEFESGIRSVDAGGIYSAAVDNARIFGNVDTVAGRVGNVMSEAQLKVTLDGVDNPATYKNVLRGLGEQLKDGADLGYRTASGKYLSYADTMASTDKLAAQLMGMDPAQMRQFFSQVDEAGALKYMGKDVDTGVRVLNAEAMGAVHKAIKGYSDEFINLDTERASALVQSSFGGQVSDVAEGVRLMEGSSAVARGQEQILDRLEFLMTVNGQGRYVRGRALNMMNMWNRLTQRGSDAATKAYAKRMAKGIKDEKNATLKALQRIAVESKDTMDTLRAVSKERPEMLAPLMMAYEFTDGSINSISKLNKYIAGSTDILKKAIIDFEPEIPSAMVQGLWSNIYNSMLSAVITPVKAVYSGVTTLVEQPLSVLVGSIGDAGGAAVMRRASYMMGGVQQTLLSSMSLGAQTFKRASMNPSDIPVFQRQDFQRINAQQIELLSATADSLAQNGDYGARVVVDQVEALYDMGNNPMLKFGINGMSSWDGFITSVNANWAARAKIYDEMMVPGQELTPLRQRAMQRKLAREMFDDSGKITDEAVKYASKEINMNLDTEVVRAIDSTLRTMPGLKPFMMFSSTSTSMIGYAGSHNPLGVFVKDLSKFSKPFSQLGADEAKTLLASRGIPFDKNAEAAYEHVRLMLKGRQRIGTVAVGAGITLFMQDRLRGDGHFDKETQKVRNNLNWKPRTIMGADGKWYNYSDLGPIGDYLAFTANLLDNFDIFRTGKNGTLNDVEFSTMLNKTAHILGASITDNFMLSGLEPLFDMLSGDGAALARWTASFGNSLNPLSGQRSELARLLSPAVREANQELADLHAQRNPMLRGLLPEKYDFVDGLASGQPDNFFQRIWNVYSPMKQHGDLSPEKKFLLDIEFDAMPTLQTDGKGVELSPTQRSEVGQKMGEQGIFKAAIAELMLSPQGQEFREAYRKAQTEKGLSVDVSDFRLLHDQLKSALRDAQKSAMASLDSADELLTIQGHNKAYAEATELGDVDEMKRIQELQLQFK